MADTFDMLRVKYLSHYSETKKDAYGKKTVTAYTFASTPIGNIPRMEWKERIERLIHDTGEDGIQAALREYCKVNCLWLHTTAEIMFYALELHACRIFENKNWVGYYEFKRRRYHPYVPYTKSK